MGSRIVLLCRVGALCFGALLDARAQEIHGSVPPPPGAPRRTVTVVTLLDSSARRLDTTVAESSGAFHFLLPGSGAYMLRFDALGSRTHVTRPFLVDSAQSLSYTHVWTEEPAEVAPRPTLPATQADSASQPDTADRAQRLGVVRVEATPEPERLFGLDVRMLAIKPIGRERLDSLARRTTDFTSVIMQLAVPGLRAFQLSGSNSFTCAVAPGSIIRPGGVPCSHVVIDGARMQWLFDLSLIDPQSVERLVVLRPIEATQFYGTGDGNGMLLIFTKTGPARGRPR